MKAKKIAPMRAISVAAARVADRAYSCHHVRRRDLGRVVNVIKWVERVDVGVA
jgi:hypothetical protein